MKKEAEELKRQQEEARLKGLQDQAEIDKLLPKSEEEEKEVTLF